MHHFIKKLDNLTSNKIAAGEVVDRPASVVKELIENAIDAQASNIIIEIQEGGKTYIRVTDNGIGIHETDVKIAFERHATSKIKTIEDLNLINSLGFRGEALASIASVSQVELTTKTKDTAIGTYLQLHGGKVLAYKEIGCSQGTTIEVKNLFYNTPARFKFMRSNASETSYISDLTSKLALAYPFISFRFINNGTIVFTTSGSGDVINNIASIYGKEIAENLYYVSAKDQHISIKAYISKPSIARGNKQLQVFFVNGRYVKSKIIGDAIIQAYKTLTMVNKFPICFIHLNIPSDKIDINIHPTKKEIRFSDEKYIQTFITNSLKNKLFEENLIPEINVNHHQKKSKDQNHIDLMDHHINLSTPITPKNTPLKYSFKQTDTGDTSSYIISDITNTNLEKIFDHPFDHPIESSPSNGKEAHITASHHDDVSKNNSSVFSNIKIIGQVFNSYLIGQDDDTLYLIDQHAAHERILYNWFIKKYKEKSIISQPLILPIIIEMSFAEIEQIKNHRSTFESLGFELDEFGINTFIIRAVPVIFGEPEAKNFFMEVVDHLQENIKSSYEVKMDNIISMACKQAIKAKEKLEPIEINELVKQLSALENPFTCPHGRPIILSMSKHEIAKKFKRT